jgi:hypothetical protein
MRREILPRESFVKFRALPQGLQGRGVQSADINLVDGPGSLEVVQGREEQIVSDHSSAYDCDIKTYWLRSHGDISLLMRSGTLSGKT